MSWTFAIVPAAVIGTSTVSGIFGMAGGMMLMGAYALMLPVASAMILHGVTQLASNASRAVMHRRHVLWSAVCWYAAGALAAAAVFASLAVSVDRATLLVALGGAPLVLALVRAPAWLRFEVPAIAGGCGLVVTGAQLVAGVSGPLVDLFFVRGGLDRYQVIGTKAVTQCFGHALKVVYFGALVGGAAPLPGWLFPVVIACAIAGSRIGKTVLDRLSEVRFRAWSTRLVMAIGLAYTLRGLLD